jgi:hypothetical protein
MHIICAKGGAHIRGQTSRLCKAWYLIVHVCGCCSAACGVEVFAVCRRSMHPLSSNVGVSSPVRSSLVTPSLVIMPPSPSTLVFRIRMLPPKTLCTSAIMTLLPIRLG